METSIGEARVRLDSCKVDNWDEEGAVAITTENEELAFQVAREMDVLYRSRFSKPMPVPSFFPDGMTSCVNIEWAARSRGKGFVMMITVETKQLSCYCKIGNDELLKDVVLDATSTRESIIAEIIDFIGKSR